MELTSSSDSEDDMQEERNNFERINFDISNFRDIFRISPTLAEYILNNIGQQIQHTSVKNNALTPNQQLLTCIRFLATNSFYSVVGHAHGVSKSTISRAIRRVVLAINHTFVSTIICWPNSLIARQNISEDFYQYSGLPCVAGAIDGTHIPIRAPKEREDQFVNRKQFHSINAMMVSTRRHYILYVSSRFPGSVNDSRVLRNSLLYEKFNSGWRPFPNAYLLADSGYPLLDWLLVPIRIPTSFGENKYNSKHKLTRHFIESTFGILKARFSVLSNTMRVNPELAGEVIKCCAVLHNLIIKETGDDGALNHDYDQFDNDAVEDNEEPDPELSEAARKQQGLARRAEIVGLFTEAPQ